MRKGIGGKTINKNVIMKKILITLIATAAIIFAACSNSQSSKENDTSKTDADSMTTAAPDTTALVEVTPTFSNVDPKVAAGLKTVVDHYLHVKNALVSNSGDEAASGGKAMAEAMSRVDKSLLTADQKKVYDDIEDDLKEHAEHIGKSSGDIAHQREHFVMMSEDVYDLAKAFGGGQPLYHDHCPMANDGKGAIWLSETREVKNPYFAGKMNECVKVQEFIRNKQ
ncbi:MAG: DUF3347 domain-containing protein [Bacteroidetes bacterium]|nr:MAG: DUF3347 domain-containing protein [Bacteroidota bacterium]